MSTLRSARAMPPSLRPLIRSRAVRSPVGGQPSASGTPGRRSRSGSRDDRDQDIAWGVLDSLLDQGVLPDVMASPHGDEVEIVGPDGRPVPGDALEVHAPGPQTEA